MAVRLMLHVAVLAAFVAGGAVLDATLDGAPRALAVSYAVVDADGPDDGAAQGLTLPVRTLRVPQGGDLQAALDAAQPGDVIVLAAGATYTGPFHLPARAGTGEIAVVSDRLGSGLPGPGQRVGPDDAPLMPRLVAASGSVLTAAPGARGYRFVGLEIAPSPGRFLTNVIDLGSDASSAAETPRDIVFDRCYIHGDPRRGSRRGIALNGAAIEVRHSHLSDFKEVGADSQAIAGWNGPGPFRIEDNYLEGAGENVMFGGADPGIPQLVPADIEILRNHFAKPLTWREDHADYAGTPWAVKNLLELKNARRVRVEGNLFEYVWPHAQNGFAILFTVRNQEGTAPWSVVEDVTFAHNTVRHVASGVNLLGRDDIRESRQTRGIAIVNNLFLDVGGPWGEGRLFQLLHGAADVTIAHNTAVQSDGFLFAGDTLPHTGVSVVDNIALHNRYGVFGSGSGVGLPTLDRYLPGVVFRGNVLVGGEAGRYPLGNRFPARLEDVGLAAIGRGDASLVAGSDLRGTATDGGDPGVDMAALAAAQQPRPAAPAEVARDRRLAALVGGAAGGTGVERSIAPAAVAVFWAGALLVVYVFLGYPATVWLEARLWPRPVRSAPIRPTVAVVVVAHDEGGRIEQRLLNLLALDYPRERLRVVVASDGSNDDTVARAARFAPRVTVRDFAVRRGKAAVLAEVVPALDAEIVVFADARQRFAADAVTRLVEAFGDPDVGAVSGELVLEAPGAGARGAGMGAYWRYEKFIRRQEAQVDSIAGATGAIYAIRRRLFEPPPPDTILDDVWIPARVARAGYRVTVEPRALAYDRVQSDGHEFARKTRTIAGTCQLLARERWLLDLRVSRLWLPMVAHKGLRLVLPGAYLAVAAATLALAAAPFYTAMLGLEVAVVAAAVAAARWPAFGRLAMPMRLVAALGVLTAATGVGIVRFLRGRESATWARSREAADGGPGVARRSGPPPREAATAS